MLSARTFLVGSSGESWSRFHSPKNMELWDLLSKSQNTNSSCHYLKHVLYGNVKKLSSFPFQYWFSTLSTDQTPYESHVSFTLGRRDSPVSVSLHILRRRIVESTKSTAPHFAIKWPPLLLLETDRHHVHERSCYPWCLAFLSGSGKAYCTRGARWHLPNVNLNGAMWC